MQSCQHPVSAKACWWATLGHKHEFTEETPEFLDIGGSFMEQRAHQIHDLPQFFQSDCRGQGVKLKPQPHHDLRRGGFVAGFCSSKVSKRHWSCAKWASTSGLEGAIPPKSSM